MEVDAAAVVVVDATAVEVLEDVTLLAAAVDETAALAMSFPPHTPEFAFAAPIEDFI